MSTQADLHAQMLTGLSEAWSRSDIAAVDAALLAWRDAGGEANLEYQLQSVYANALLERDTLVQSVRQAERLARAARDEVALARIAASVIDALYSDWRPSREGERWIDALRSVDFVRLQSIRVDKRLHIAAGILAAELFGEALAIADRVANSVVEWCSPPSVASATLRGNALGYSLEYFSGRRDWVRAREVVARIDSLAVEAGFGDLAQARIAARRGFYFHYRRGDYAGALAQSRLAVERAADAKVSRAAREASITVTLCHLMRGELEAADQALRAESAAIPEGHLMMRANVHYERAWWHALKRDVISAQRELDIACELFTEIDEHGVMSLATPSLQAQLLVQVGEYESALHVYETRVRRPNAWLADIALIEALAALARGDRASALLRLKEGVDAAAGIDIKGIFWACRSELGTLLDLALQENFEPEWVKSVQNARLLADVRGP